MTAIVLNSGATMNGRALAQTAVTLDSNAVSIPGGFPATTVTTNAMTVPTSTAPTSKSTTSATTSP